MNEFSAWHEAMCGQTPRIIKIYVGTIRRAYARGLIPKAIVYGLKHEGWTMFVKHQAFEGGFFPARMFTVTEDGIVGFGVQPPAVFKNWLRSYMTRKQGESVQ